MVALLAPGCGRWQVERRIKMEEAEWIGTGVQLEVGRYLAMAWEGDGECSFECVRSMLLSRLEEQCAGSSFLRC